MIFFYFHMSSVPTPRNKYTRSLYRLTKTPKYELSRRFLVKYLVSRSSIDFNPGDSGYTPLRVSYNPRTQRGSFIRDTQYRVSSADVFWNVTILPYAYIGTQSSVQPELDFLAPQLTGKHPRVPAIYRISDTWIIDDMGRLYSRTLKGFTWYQYRLSGDLRSNITLTNSDGTHLTRPCYVFSGLAGYLPSIQRHFAFSLKYDFHHVQENKLDLRPDSVVPLETDLHRYVHSRDLTDEVGKFFKQKSKW